MATGPLRFRTPHIEELPITQTKKAPGFAYVAVAASRADPSKNWGTDNRKRGRDIASLQTDSQREALSARQQRETERKIRELNSDNSKDVQIPLPKKEGGGGGGPARAGKTTNTKKILASGKTFAHYLDDEEAEIARTGRRDGEMEVVPPAVQQQRASKTPIARRMAREESSVGGSPAPLAQPLPALHGGDAMDTDFAPDDEDDTIPPVPTQAEIEALLRAPPLTYNQARSAPSTCDVPASTQVLRGLRVFWTSEVHEVWCDDLQRLVPGFSQRATLFEVLCITTAHPLPTGWSGLDLRRTER